MVIQLYIENLSNFVFTIIEELKNKKFLIQRPLTCIFSINANVIIR